MSDVPTARYRPETRLVHSGTLRSQFGETSEALFLTQGFVYDSAEQCEARFKGEDTGFLYSRFSNPNVSMFERRMIELEGAEAARATATGMAAVTTAILAPLKAGDHVVAAKAMFGSCRYVVEDLLPRYGISSTLVDGLDLDQWQAAMRPNTKSCFLESPTTPTLDVLDIGGIAEIAHAAGARLIVDNVFATPIWQSPLQLGADVVVYSATKHIDGQGRTLGGAILGTEEFITGPVQNLMRHTGPSMSPFNAWVLTKGYAKNQGWETAGSIVADGGIILIVAMLVLSWLAWKRPRLNPIVAGLGTRVVVKDQFARRFVPLPAVAGDATAVEDRLDVTIVLDVLDGLLEAKAHPILAVPRLAGLIVGPSGQQRRALRQVEDGIVGLGGRGFLEARRLLAVGVAAAAIVPDFTWP